MNSTDLSVIIPAPTFELAKPVLASLRAQLDPNELVEIIVAVGRRPSTQRNRAIAKAKGNYLIFLDGDCEIRGNHFTRIRELAAARSFDILGGPVHLKEGANFTQQVFQAALSHPLIVGGAASRYFSKGKLRITDERELILCNMVVKKDLFEKNGGFNERLYPNEENEWMDRLGSETKIYYDPTLIVDRPQRRNFAAYLRMLIGYGRGRTEQARVSQKPSLKQAPPFCLLVAILLALISREMFKLELILLVTYMALVMATARNSCPTIKHKIVVGLLAPVTIVTYAFGQIIGFFTRLPFKPEPAAVRLYDHSGRAMI